MVISLKKLGEFPRKIIGWPDQIPMGYGGFLKSGGTPKSSICRLIFHEINNPSILGYPHEYGNHTNGHPKAVGSAGSNGSSTSRSLHSPGVGAFQKPWWTAIRIFHGFHGLRTIFSWLSACFNHLTSFNKATDDGIVGWLLLFFGVLKAYVLGIVWFPWSGWESPVRTRFGGCGGMARPQRKIARVCCHKMPNMYVVLLERPLIGFINKQLHKYIFLCSSPNCLILSCMLDDQATPNPNWPELTDIQLLELNIYLESGTLWRPHYYDVFNVYIYIIFCEHIIYIYILIILYIYSSIVNDSLLWYFELYVPLNTYLHIVFL